MEKEFGGLPEGWELVLLDTISEDISYGYTASSVVEPIGPKMLRITDIQNNTVNWQLVPYCQIDEKKKPQYLMKAGDLVFARTGATVGKSYLIKNDVPDSVYASYLIAKAFRGELTEQWRKDHPELISGENSAAALLEKIKAERVAQTKKSKKKA